MMTQRPGDGTTWWLAVAALAGFGLFLVLYELNDYRTLTKHEGFVAVVSQEMLESGNWIVPRFGGLPRLKKPPLGYWCAAAVSGAIGEHAPWTARLPSAASALLLSALIGAWAGKWHGRWAGLAAALVQISCVYVLSFSRKAEVDMLLCLLTTSALFLVANGSREENRTRRALRWIGIYALVGLSWLAKFHYGPAMVLGVIAVWHLIDRRRPGVWDAFNPIGLAVLAAAVIVWPWLLLQKLPAAWDIWQVETVGRALGELGRKPVWYYLPEIVLQALPWSVLLLKAGRDSFQRAWRENDRRERFLWVWFITQFLILSASAFKHHHYLMAAMPALSLILGRSLAEIALSLGAGNIEISAKRILCLAGAGGLVGAASAVGVSQHWQHLKNAGMGFGVCFAVTSLLASYWLFRRRWVSYLGTMGIGLAICYAILMTSIFPYRDSRRPYVEFAKSVRDHVPRNQPVCLFGLKEDPLVYYLEGQVFRAESSIDLIRELNRRGSMIVITDRDHQPELVLQGYAVEQTSVRQTNPSEEPPLVLVRISPHRLASAIISEDRPPAGGRKGTAGGMPGRKTAF